MIKRSGTRPIKRIPRKQFHVLAGGTLDVPDFNLDSGVLMQDQDADGAPTECTGYGVTDDLYDINKIEYTPDFQYASTLFLEGVKPSTGGADPLVAMQSAVVFGSLQKSQANISAKTDGELFIANWENWQPFLKTSAFASKRPVDVRNALGFTDSFTSIISAAWNGDVSVHLTTPWYNEWQNPPENGVLPMPANPSNVDGLPWHFHSIKGKKTVNGSPLAIDKSWQGSGVGDNGLLYFTPQVLNAVLEVPGTSALIFVMSGTRFVPYTKIMLQHINSSFVPLLTNLPIGQ